MTHDEAFDAAMRGLRARPANRETARELFDAGVAAERERCLATDLEAVPAEPDEWSFWEAAGLTCGGYDSEQDYNLIRVFIETSKEKSWYADIANRLNLPKLYVGLLMEILCSADFCEYGTSPRGAWAIHTTYEGNVARLKAWYARSWGQPFPEDPVCPACGQGNLRPYDHRGIAMARCDRCGIEVNAPT